MGTTVFLLVYVGLVALVLWILLQSIRRGWRRYKPMPYEALTDPFTPPPVERTLSARLVGLGSAAWADLHLLAILIWLATGVGLKRDGGPIALAIYLTLAALLTGVGGALLFFAKAMGRRLIGWGQWLFAVAMLWMLGFALRMPGSETVGEEIRSESGYILAFLAAHLLIDVLLGTLAQRVGRPVGWKKRIEPTLEERQAMRQWTAGTDGTLGDGPS